MYLPLPEDAGMQSQETIEQHIAYEKMLAELSENTVRVDGINVFLKDSIRRMGSILDVSMVFVFSFNEEEDSFDCVCGWDELKFSAHKAGDNDFTLHILWATRQLKTGRIINYQDTRDMPGQCYRRRLLKEKVLSTLNVPLFIRGELYGFVGFDEHRFNSAWRNEDLYILTTAAQIIVRTIEDKQYEAELEEHRNMLGVHFQQRSGRDHHGGPIAADTGGQPGGGPDLRNYRRAGQAAARNHGRLLRPLPRRSEANPAGQKHPARTPN